MKVLIKTSDEETFVKLVETTAEFRDLAEFHISTSKTIDSNYDIGISYMFHHKVSKEHLQKPWFNFHPAPLPEFKGRNLCYWAIMNEAEEFGATLHYMDENYDTGDIIKVRKFDIEPWMTAEDLSDLARAASYTLLVEYLPRIVKGEQFERIPNVGGVYYKKSDIDNQITLLEGDERRVRAITYRKFLPVTNVNGVWYNIMRAG